MDQVAQDIATMECAAFTKALDEVLTKFGFHTSLVLVVGQGHGSPDHTKVATLAIKGCRDCAVNALGQAIWNLPDAMRLKFVHAWLEKSRSTGTGYQPDSLVH